MSDLGVQPLSRYQPSLALALFTILTTLHLCAGTPAAPDTPPTSQREQRHNQLRFTHPVRDPRLSQSPIEAILQDQEGFLWFGTGNGLYQYDAYELTQFLPEKPDSQKIALSEKLRVTSLFEDDQQRLWIGTNVGVIVLGPSRERLFHFQHDPHDDQSIPSNEITEIDVDSNGTIWVGTANGLNRFSEKRRQLERYLPGDPLSPQLTSQISGIATSPNGDLWIATAGPGIIARKTSETETFEIQFQFADAILCLLASRDGGVWFGTWGHGLIHLDPKTGQTRQFLPELANPYSLSSDVVTKIIEDDQGTLWIATFDKGLNRLDPRSEVFLHDQSDPDIPGSLGFNSVYWLYQDNSKAIWCGLQQRGVDRYSRRESMFRYLERDRQNRAVAAPSATTSLLLDEDERLWIGSRFEGLTLYDPQTETYDLHRTAPQRKGALPTDAIRSLARHPDGSILVGTFREGLCQWLPQERTFKRFPISGPDPISKASGTTPFGLTADRSGKVWIGYERYGMERLNPATGDRLHFPDYLDSVSKDSHDSVWPIFEDSTGTLWISTHYQGMQIMDPETLERRQKIPSIIDPSNTPGPAFSSIVEGPDGCIWATSSVGLYRWRSAESSVERIGKEQDFPTEHIYSIAISPDNTLWAATDIGIVRYEIDQETVETFRFGEELEYIGFYRGASAITSSQRIYFGGNSGVLYFETDQLKKNTVPPPVKFREFQIENSPWQRWTNNSASSILLRYPNNTLGFRLSALAYSFPSLNRYA